MDETIILLILLILAVAKTDSIKTAQLYKEWANETHVQFCTNSKRLNETSALFSSSPFCFVNECKITTERVCGVRWFCGLETTA